MKTITYSFRTCKIRTDFVFGKIKKDLETFYERVLKEKPELIIGYGNGREGYEQYVINNFHGKKILKNGPEKYQLDSSGNEKPTNSFCNYATYKIKHFLETNNLNTKLVFKHVKC